MKSLKVLQPKDLFRFACPEDVREMPQQGKGHFCGSCSKVVVDLSRATLDEAVDTIRSATTSTCVSYAVESGGGLVFRDLLKGSKIVTVAAFLAACQGAPTDAKHPDPTQPANVDGAAQLSDPGSTSGSDEPAYPSATAAIPPFDSSDQTSRWPSAVAENPVDPPPVPTRGRVAVPKPRPPHVLAGKPAPPPDMVTGEPMIAEPPPVAGAPMPVNVPSQGRSRGPTTSSEARAHRDAF